MRERINRRLPQAAIVISIVALVAAVGGGAYAAVKLTKNSVKTKAIKNAAVTNPKLAAKAVSGAKLGDVVVRTAEESNIQDPGGVSNGGAVGESGLITASCQGSERLLTGGAHWTVNNDPGDNIYINQSYPEGNSWKAQGIVDYGAGGNSTLQVVAICLK